MNKSSYSKNRLVVPGSENAIKQMKYEVASELGVNLGADASSRQNGKVGGEMTRRLVTMAKSNLKSNSNLLVLNITQLILLF